MNEKIRYSEKKLAATEQNLETFEKNLKEQQTLLTSISKEKSKVEKAFQVFEANYTTQMQQLQMNALKGSAEKEYQQL